MTGNDYLFRNVLANHRPRRRTDERKSIRKPIREEIPGNRADMRWMQPRIRERLWSPQTREQDLYHFFGYINLTDIKRVVISFIYKLVNLIRSCISGDRNVKVTCISKGLTEIPVDFSKKIKIYALDASYNCIQCVSDKIGDLPHLRHLRLANNCINTVADNLKALTELVYLDLTNNNLKTFPNCITDMHWVKKLGLGNCRLCDLPRDIRHMVSLEQLGLYGNNFRTLCSEIGYLESLIRLDLSDNVLQSLPRGIGKLKNLEWLNLSSNQLTDLPIEINNLSKLKELGLGNNHLSRLPDILGLRSLELLSLVGNQLETLDAMLVNLKSLRILDVGYNKIHWVSPYIFEMDTLETLYLQHNNLQHLPFVNVLISLGDKVNQLPLSKLANKTDTNRPYSRILNSLGLDERVRFYNSCRRTLFLDTLDISNNELTSVPFPFLEIPNLLFYYNPFDLEDNRITDPLETYLISEKLQLSDENAIGSPMSIRYILCEICKHFTPTPGFMFNYKQFGTICKITNTHNQFQQIDNLPISYPICRCCNKQSITRVPLN